MKNSFKGRPTLRTKSIETKNETNVNVAHLDQPIRQMNGVLRQIVNSEPLTDWLNVNTFAVQVENVAAKNSLLADDRRSGDKFRQRLPPRVRNHRP